MPTVSPAELAHRPCRLRADNFTPASRTPWGGTRIVRSYKASLGVAPPGTLVGESWEVSVEPSFPSRLADHDLSLAEVIAAAPDAWLGAAVAARHGGQTPLLIKLLDSAAPLSVQVHPQADDPGLAPDESGKPECWLVLDAEPGAGLYLGLREGVDRETVARCLREAGPLDDLLNFVPVAPGALFVIGAGTPHAVGAGVTLVEPQLVTPGRRGVTYRFWDWNRRYDPDGRRDEAGAPRALHVERSLAVTDWSALRGAAFVESCRASPRLLVDGDVRRHELVRQPWVEVERWSGSGTLTVPAADVMRALLCLRGCCDVRAAAGGCSLRCGESCVVPSAAGVLQVEADDVDLVVVSSPA